MLWKEVFCCGSDLLATEVEGKETLNSSSTIDYHHSTIHLCSLSRFIILRTKTCLRTCYFLDGLNNRFLERFSLTVIYSYSACKRNDSTTVGTSWEKKLHGWIAIWLHISLEKVNNQISNIVIMIAKWFLKFPKL